MYSVKLAPLKSNAEMVMNVSNIQAQPDIFCPKQDPRTDTCPAIWAESFTKLLAFNQKQYDRVLSLDSDATILQVRSPGQYYINHLASW